jgi:hypothetical protein
MQVKPFGGRHFHNARPEPPQFEDIPDSAIVGLSPHPLGFTLHFKKSLLTKATSPNGNDLNLFCSQYVNSSVTVSQK